MRKLITLRVVADIFPIPGADMIECAVVDGWTCVVKKNEFKIGDIGIYAEIDSILPVRPEFEFLRKSSYKKFADGSEGFRLKSVRLRKQLSQGLLLPLSGGLQCGLLDADLTEAFNVTKYEPTIPAVLSGDARGGFPIHLVAKTDQERCQNLSRELSVHAEQGTIFYPTIKLDGSSMTCYIDPDDQHFGVCSRNLELKDTEGNTFWTVAKNQRIEQVLRNWHQATGNYLALQMELMGPGIQKNREGFVDHRAYLFNVFDITNQRTLTPIERSVFATTNEVMQAPSILPTKLPTADTVKYLLDKAEGHSINNTVREGLVFVSADAQFSFKAISNLFLTSGGEEE